MPEDTLSADDVRSRLGISTATYYRWLKAGRLPGTHTARGWRFPRSVVDDLLGRSVGEGRTLVEAALESGADSVHLEPRGDRWVVRHRRSGRLVEDAPGLGRRAGETLLAQVRELVGLPPEPGPGAEHVRSVVELGDRRVHVLAATYPTPLGRALTLRLVDPAKRIPAPADLGLAEDVVARLGELLASHRGLLVVNGPSDSGKTTTLYSLLTSLDDPELKRMSIEDPVELPLEGVVQGEVREGFDFVEALRAMLRCEVDVALVGEIRDAQVAGLVVGAASVRALVLTALHAPDAQAAVNRLAELDTVPSSMLRESLLGVLDQRLAPGSCASCRTMIPLSPGDAAALGLAPGTPVARNEGCPECDGTGRSGRVLLAALHVPGEERPDLRAAARHAVEQGRVEPAAAIAALRH